MTDVTIGPVTFGNSRPFALIAGPCAMESREHAFALAGSLKEMCGALGIGLIYKSSFDKANRTSGKAGRGIGLEKALAVFADVKSHFGLPVITDVHEPGQCVEVASVVDCLQIPAFLCRQTDLLEAAGRTGKPVNVKKGQFLHPEGMRGAVAKVRAAGPSEVAVTERGTFFGYGDLVVDMRGIPRMRAACDAPVIFDATHSVQQPGLGSGGASGGVREMIPTLTMAALAAGVDGLFLETHPDPANAPSDGPNMIPLGELDALLDRALAIWSAARR